MKNPFQTNLPFLALLNLSTMASLVSGQCPFANRLKTRQEQGSSGDSRSFIQHNDVEDGDVYMTSDVGGPIADQRSLRAGDRGPTLLEDFIFRQKITRFDHERVCFETRGPFLCSSSFPRPVLWDQLEILLTLTLENNRYPNVLSTPEALVPMESSSAMATIAISLPPPS